VLKDQGALQLKGMKDAVPGDGHGVDSDNESSSESESERSEESLSSSSDNSVLSLISTASSGFQKKIERLENTLREIKKKADQTLQALLEKSNLFSDSL